MKRDRMAEMLKEIDWNQEPAPAETAPRGPRGPLVDAYKGKPMLVLNPDTDWPFQFDVKKAKLIVEHFEVIKQFVAQFGASDDDGE